MSLLVLTAHWHELDGVEVNEVATLGVAEIVEGRVVLERPNAAHGDVGHTDVVLAVVGEASLCVHTLLRHFDFESVKEVASSKEDVVRVLRVAAKLTNFLAEFFREGLVGRGRGDGRTTNEGAMPPPSGGSAVDAASCTNSGGVGDDGQDAGNLLRIGSAVFPEHFVERTAPAFGHVLKFVLKQTSQHSEFAVAVVADALALGRIHNGNAVVFEFGEGNGDTSMDFFPRVVHALEVGGVGIRNGVVVSVPSDSCGVITFDRDRDVALATGEGLLVALKSFDEGFVLDGLREGWAFDVIIKSSRRNVSDFLGCECHSF